MKQGLVEWALVTAFLALAAAGAAHFLGDDIRAAFGVRRPPAGAEEVRGQAPGVILGR
jgi:hypothetical protein